MLLVFHAPWCKPCVRLEKEVFTNAGVARALGDYVVQPYDIEVGEGQRAATRFGISVLPALVVLSPRGDEIERIVEQEPEPLARELRSVHDAALRAPIDDSAIAEEKDARVLLVTGKVAEKGAKYDVAERAYRAAFAASKGAQKDAAPAAAFALLKIDDRKQVARVHSRELMDFAGRFPDSVEALRAIDGVAALLPHLRPDPATLGPLATKMIEPRRAAHDGVALRRLSETLKLLGDESDAKKAMKLAEAMGAAGAAPVASRTDPLESQCTPQPANAAPPEVLELFKKEMLFGRRLADACSAIAHNNDDQYVRLSIRDGNVERALLLDPEAPKELRQCIESAAVRQANVPAGFGARRVIRVMFPPKQ